MAHIGWWGIFMAFHHCQEPKDATLVLTNALRSDMPIGKVDRERLARLIEGKDNPLFESHCEIEVRRRRSRKREVRQSAKNDALALVHELVTRGLSIENAAAEVCDDLSRLKFEAQARGVNATTDKFEAETLRKEYPSYRRAITEWDEP